MRTALYAGPDVAHHDDIAGARTFIRTIVDRVRAWNRTRRAIRDLSTFSDEMLEDIGLTRGEIESAVTTGRRSNLEISSGWNQVGAK